MLQVELNHILTEDDALTRIRDIFAAVENDKEVYVVTKNGTPVFAIVDIDHLTKNVPSLDLTVSQQNTQPVTPAFVTPEPTPTSMPSPTPMAVFSPATSAPSQAEPIPMPALSAPPVAETALADVPPLPPMPSFNAPTPTPQPSFSAGLPPLSGTENLTSVSSAAPAAAPMAPPTPTETIPLSTIQHVEQPIPDTISTDPRNSSPLA